MFNKRDLVAGKLRHEPQFDRPPDTVRRLVKISVSRIAMSRIGWQAGASAPKSDRKLRSHYFSRCLGVVRRNVTAFKNTEVAGMNGLERESG